MRILPGDRVALMVDGQNLWHASRALQIDIDYKKLKDHFDDPGIVVRASYFTRMDDGEDFTPIRPLADWLDYHSWEVITRNKDTDVELAVAMMDIAEHVGVLVLVSGDGDFCSAVKAVQRRYCRVIVISTIRANGSGYSCSDELRRQADEFIDLYDLKDRIARPARPAKEVA